MNPPPRALVAAPNVDDRSYQSSHPKHEIPGWSAPKTRILCRRTVWGFKNASRSLDHHFGYENNETEKRGSCQTQSTSAMSFQPSRSGFFLHPCVKRVFRETQKIKGPYVPVRFKLISPRVSAFLSSLWFARGNVTPIPASGYIGIESTII